MYLLQALNRWSIVDDNTGELNEGVTVYYLDNSPIEEENKKGYFPLKVSADIKLFDKIKKVPCFADIDFGMKPDSKGKPKLYVKDINVVDGKVCKLYE